MSAVAVEATGVSVGGVGNGTANAAGAVGPTTRFISASAANADAATQSDSTNEKKSVASFIKGGGTLASRGPGRNESWQRAENLARRIGSRQVQRLSVSRLGSARL